MPHRKTSGAVVTLIFLALWLIPSTGAQKRDAAKPRVAVLEFKKKADNQRWYHGGAAAAQDVFVTALTKGKRYNVVDREELHALIQQKTLR
jgi:curli biogenesis system outer membrane secretion channel CsgG